MARKLNNELLRDMAESVADVPDGRMLNNDYLRIIAENFSGGGDGTVDASSIVGVIPAENLPSYVDDVLEYSSQSALPATGETGKIYVTTDTNTTYRWSGSVYVPISNPLDYATQAEAEAGAENTHVMTPLRTKQAIDANAYELPLMSESTRGGAKLGHGLTVEDGALGIGSVTDPTDAGPIVELTANGWAEQDTTVDPPSPSPSFPQEIEVCRGRNLLDYDAWKTSSIQRGTAVWENNGVTLTATGNDCYTVPSTRVAVTEGQTITVSWKVDGDANGSVYVFLNGDLGVSTYRNSKNFRSLSYTIPEGGEYVTFRFGVTNSGTTLRYSDIQIELGTEATPYVPYGCVGVDVQGRNLLPSGPDESATINGVTFTRADGVMTVNGTATSSGGRINAFFKTQKAALAAGTYTFSASKSIQCYVEALSDNTILATTDNNPTFTLTEPTDVYVGYNLVNGSVYNNVSIAAQIEAGSVAHPYVPHYHATIPIPLPSRGWVAALPDGTADTLALDGAGGYVWTLNTRMTTQAVTDGVTGTVGVNVMSSTGQIADGATVLYKDATTTESGYVLDMPTVPSHASLTMPEMRNLTVRCCADEGAAEIASAWGKRYVETTTEMQSDVAEIATGLATLEDGVADLSASIADLTDVVAYHDERIERNASDIASMRKSLLRRESDGYYDNQSVTAFLSAKFDGRLYGYSEPKTTATEVTKTGANAGIPNPTLGTATVAGTSEYRDLGPFQWFAAKGYVDADGVPHVKTIRGIDSDADWDACTDNVWSLRPVVWYSVDESGSSVIGSLSDTWHLGLSPNPQAYLPDGTLRPYMLAARYALGFENGVGVSKSGLKGYGRDVSHNSLITKLGYASSGYSGKSIYEQWYDVFMSRMIYGTKDFQTVMQGCTSYTYQYNPAVAETGVKRVILTNAQAAGLLVGSTMMLGTRVGASSNDRNQANNFDVFDGARITSIEEYDANNKAVYFDVDEAFDTDTTYLLSTAPWHSGSCDAMDWDGSPTSPQSAKEVAFFQGCELMHGAAEILAGVIISNDGVTGWTPYVVHDTRDDATSLTEDFVSCGAALPTDDTDSWKYPLYVSDHGGLMYGTTTGGSSTTGASDGHYTNKLATTGAREWRSSGNLSDGRIAGPSCVRGNSTLGYSYWSFWSRLSGTGRSRG